jgi:hypothetical protein
MQLNLYCYLTRSGDGSRQRTIARWYMRLIYNLESSLSILLTKHGGYKRLPRAE